MAIVSVDFGGGMEKVLFVSVVYSTTPSQASTIISLSKLEFEQHNIDPAFAIWDNSQYGFGRESVPNLPGKVEYFHTGKNEYLSRVYNKIIQLKYDVDWVVILDDDSIIDDRYLASIVKFFGSGLNLAVPMIEYNNGLISPGMQIGVRGKQLTHDAIKLGVNPSTNMVAMMSGTIIKRSLFEQGLCFDERLSFYGVDTRFFIDYSKRCDSLYILDVKMSHDSALRDMTKPAHAQIERLKNLFLSKKIVFEDLPFHRTRLVVYLIMFMFNQAIKRRTFSTFFLIKLIPRLI